MAFHLQIIFLVLLCASCMAEEECKDVQLTDDRGEFTSPNFPNKYPHNADCMWTITAPEDHRIQLEFKEFFVEDPFWSCSNDFVTVALDGVTPSERYCVQEDDSPPKAVQANNILESSGNKIVIKLKSDHFFDNGKGFRAEYRIITEDGVPVAGEDDATENEDEDWDWDETDPVTKSAATTTTKSTTTTKPTTTTTPSTTMVTTTTTPPKTTSTLVKKITDAVESNRNDDDDDDDDDDDSGTGISNNPGAMSGAVLGSIIGAVLIVFCILLIVAFVHWKRNKNKRIDLSTVETHDGKTLIQKKYKKQNNRIVRIPEAETFPL